MGKNEGEVFDVPMLVEAFCGGPEGTTKNNKKRWSGHFIENIVSWFYATILETSFFRKLAFGKFSWARLIKFGCLKRGLNLDPVLFLQRGCRF